ncbi:MAG: UDP-N-acetylmuramoyl-tripeptide--D-alanyl-D-alanine ligase, partial [Gammaproteobacteria bacterium]|nr:UDP-N-acetylmuramoyl-tripeptide--D-alanyl-D-alanine ligase [Gammaproteobacteria bacterium]
LLSSLEGGDWKTCFDVITPHGVIDIQLALAGRHNVQNALAAIAVACAVDIPVADIVSGLAAMQAVSGRMQIRKGIGEWSVIDDSYNANPVSLNAAIEMLATLSGAKIVVMGDMAELGEDTIALHQHAGRTAKEYGIDQLYAVGPLSAHAVNAFGEGAKHYTSQLALINDLITDLHSVCACQANTILVKGSRSAGMERVVAALVADTVKEPLIKS